MRYTLAELADHVNGQVIGDSQYCLRGLAPITSPKPTCVSFILKASQAATLAEPESIGALLAPIAVDSVERMILVDDPYMAYAKLSRLFDCSYRTGQGVHEHAYVAEDVELAPDVFIGANAVIEKSVRIGKGTYVGAGSVVGEGAVLGENCYLHSNVTLYDHVTLGDECIIHSGAVIGADGFGFAPKKPGWQKIYQLGSVTIGDNVEIGANTTVDRGALSDTLIGNGVKLDNQIQIGHNVEIGDNTAIAACAAIAGSTKIGRSCTIAGHSGIVGHISIADNSHIAAMTLISKSIVNPGAYASGTVMQPLKEWKRSVVHFRQLDELSKRVKQLEKLLSDRSKG